MRSRARSIAASIIPVMIGEELHEAFAYLPVDRDPGGRAGVDA